MDIVNKEEQKEKIEQNRKEERGKERKKPKILWSTFVWVLYLYEGLIKSWRAVASWNRGDKGG